MKVKFVIFLLFIATGVIAQQRGKIIDAETKEPIPYVNIWVQGKDKGTTSAENGDFVLSEVLENQIIVFSALGFETKKISVKEMTHEITLVREIMVLNEVVVSSKKEVKETTVGAFNRFKIRQFFGAGDRPKIWARYFPYRPEYNETPFLKSIKFLTLSNESESKFNIRFYSVSTDGSPGDFLYSENVIVMAKKGNRKTKVNLAALNIPFPEEGLFVAFEWFIIEENKYEVTYKEDGKKFKDFWYNPSIGTITEKTDVNSWLFLQGEWQKPKKNYFEEDEKKGKEVYNLLAIELELSN